MLCGMTRGSCAGHPRLRVLEAEYRDKTGFKCHTKLNNSRLRTETGHQSALATEDRDICSPGLGNMALLLRHMPSA